MTYGSVSFFVLIATIVVLVSAGILFLAGTVPWGQERPRVVDEGGNTAGISCPLPSNLDLGASQGSGPEGLIPDLDRSVLASGRLLEMATFSLG